MLGVEKIDCLIDDHGNILPAPRPFIFTVTCLAIGLNQNKKLADNIIERLKDNGYEYKVYSSLYYRSAEIEFRKDSDGTPTNLFHLIDSSQE